MSIKNNNKKIGKKSEQELAQQFHDKGWWVHLLQPDDFGNQPFDLIAVKNNLAWMLDVKNVEGSELMGFGRIEPNQRGAFDILTKTGSYQCGFALKFDDGFYFFSYLDFLNLEKEKRFTILKKELLSLWFYVG